MIVHVDETLGKAPTVTLNFSSVNSDTLNLGNLESVVKNEGNIVEILTWKHAAIRGKLLTAHWRPGHETKLLKVTAPHAEALIPRPIICAQICIHIHIHVCINA